VVSLLAMMAPESRHRMIVTAHLALTPTCNCCSSDSAFGLPVACLGRHAHITPAANRSASWLAGHCPDLLLALIVGSYIDHKCPFTGNVSIRGRILSGTVKSTKMNRTLIVRRNYLHFIKKYQRCAA
jgi:Ribosomal_S17 N-terminal